MLGFALRFQIKGLGRWNRFRFLSQSRWKNVRTPGQSQELSTACSSAPVTSIPAPRFYNRKWGQNASPTSFTSKMLSKTNFFTMVCEIVCFVYPPMKERNWGQETSWHFQTFHPCLGPWGWKCSHTSSKCCISVSAQEKIRCFWECVTSDLSHEISRTLIWTVKWRK